MQTRNLLLLLILCTLALQAGSQSLKVMTYNIRFDNPGDGPNAWPMRKDWLCRQVRQVNPGIFGIQEGLAHQVNYLDSALDGFSYIGVGRDDGASKGEFSAIFYNNSLYKLLKQSTFWLSPTPGKPSMGWDAACIRICTCGLFEDTGSGYKFWVFNTHFDHMGAEARKNSAILIVDKIETLNKKGYPVILTGDFNGGPVSEPVVYLSSHLFDTYHGNITPQQDTVGTFNGFGHDLPDRERIDYIFTGKNGFTVIDYYVLREYQDGLFPSDHFPVVAELRFEPPKKP